MQYRSRTKINSLFCSCLRIRLSIIQIIRINDTVTYTFRQPILIALQFLQIKHNRITVICNRLILVLFHTFQFYVCLYFFLSHCFNSHIHITTNLYFLTLGYCRNNNWFFQFYMKMIRRVKFIQLTYLLEDNTKLHLKGRFVWHFYSSGCNLIAQYFIRVVNYLLQSFFRTKNAFVCCYLPALIILFTHFLV